MKQDSLSSPFRNISRNVMLIDPFHKQLERPTQPSLCEFDEKDFSGWNHKSILLILQ